MARSLHYYILMNTKTFTIKDASISLDTLKLIERIYYGLGIQVNFIMMITK